MEATVALFDEFFRKARGVVRRRGLYYCITETFEVRPPLVLGQARWRSVLSHPLGESGWLRDLDRARDKNLPPGDINTWGLPRLADTDGWQELLSSVLRSGGFQGTHVWEQPTRGPH